MQNPAKKPLIGVSSCLLGSEVRFDSGHKKNKLVTNVLSEYFDYQSFCPEVSAGMGIPRQPVRLVSKGGEIRVVGVRNSDQDFTDQLQSTSEAYCNEHIRSLSGYIIKNRSPSCGMTSVKLYNEHGMPYDKTTGVFTRQVMKSNPLLPVEEEGRLCDSRILNNFLTRVFVYHDWKKLTESGSIISPQLIEFHTSHKYLLLAHSEVIYRNLGKVLATTSKQTIEEAQHEYITTLMNGLKRLPTRSTHSNVLFHMAGFFKRYINSDDKKELMQAIDLYRIGKQSIAAPITLLLHYLRHYPSNFLVAQKYLHYQKLLAQF